MGIPAPLLPGTWSLRGQGDVSWARREKAGQPGIIVRVASIFASHLCDFLCLSRVDVEIQGQKAAKALLGPKEKG